MPFQPLFKDIFDKDESDAGAANFMQQAVKEYPYFSLAHFFLLKQTAAKDADYAKISAKTALHFNNSFLLDSQLHKRLPVTASEVKAEAEATFVSTAHVTDTTPVEAIPSTQYDSDQPEIKVEVEGAENSFTHLPAENVELPEASQHPVSAITVEVEHAAVAAAQETVTDENQPVSPVTLNKPTLGAAMPSVDGSMLFTPLYATDYFASQGIKLREEALPNDKLGKQLKSFTEWLKTMKKVHDNKLPAGSEVLDRSVQKLAEKSNKEEQVITESMADVFLQQGKLHKAKEIYEKLSLLDPAKIAYFAAKIDQIQKK